MIRPIENKSRLPLALILRRTSYPSKSQSKKLTQHRYRDWAHNLLKYYDEERNIELQIFDLTVRLSEKYRTQQNNKTRLTRLKIHHAKNHEIKSLSIEAYQSVNQTI